MLKDLENKLNVNYVTDKEMQEIISSYHENDVSIFFDKDLTALIDDLLYNGYDFLRIQELNNQLYGNFIEFYFIPEKNQYVMVIGTR